jgi:hypothetical protein
MDWNRFEDARALLQANRPEAAIPLLRELRLSSLHPAVAPLLAQALKAADDPEAGEQVLAEDCTIGIADHWSWLARAELAVVRGQPDQASHHRAQAYERLGWPGCMARNYHFERDEVSQLLPRWCRVFALLLPIGPLRVLSVQGGAGDFALWALERLAQRGGQLTTLGHFDALFLENLARCDREATVALHHRQESTPAAPGGNPGPYGESQHPSLARSGDGDPFWDVIHLGPGCLPADAWQKRLRPQLRPEGVMLAHDPNCLTGEETIVPGVLVAAPAAAANPQPRSS